MQLSLNNEKIQIDHEISLSEFLEHYGYGNSQIAVALNLNLIPKNQYQEVILKEHDVIDIIVPMQGG